MQTSHRDRMTWTWWMQTEEQSAVWYAFTWTRVEHLSFGGDAVASYEL